MRLLRLTSRGAGLPLTAMLAIMLWVPRTCIAQDADSARESDDARPSVAAPAPTAREGAPTAAVAAPSAMPRVMWFKSSDAAINGRLHASPVARRMDAHVAFLDSAVELKGAVDLQIPVVIASIQAHVGFHAIVGVPREKLNATTVSFPVRSIDVSLGQQGDLGLGETEVKHLVLQALVDLAMQQPDLTRAASIQYVRASSALQVTLRASPVRGYAHAKVVRTQVTPAQGMVELLVW